MYFHTYIFYSCFHLFLIYIAWRDSNLFHLMTKPLSNGWLSLITDALCSSSQMQTSWNDAAPWSARIQSKYLTGPRWNSVERDRGHGLTDDRLTNPKKQVTTYLHTMMYEQLIFKHLAMRTQCLTRQAVPCVTIALLDATELEVFLMDLSHDVKCTVECTSPSIFKDGYGETIE